MIALNLYTTQDTYRDAGTREQGLTVKINLQVSTAGIFIQTADNNQNFFHDEEFYPPGAYSLIRRVGGIRVRSAVAGTPAVVSFVLLREEDT